MHRISRALLYGLYLFFIIFVSLEILVRFWGYADMYLYDPIYMPFGPSREIPYILQPNLNQVRAHGKIRINTDALGLRSPVAGRTYGPKGKGEYRIAVMGDSVTFGVGVKAEETYPEVVEQYLNKLQERCQVTVFNFGVSSYSVKEMTATLKYRVPAIDPDLVIMGVIIDDFDPDRTPQVDERGYNTHGGPSTLVNRYPTLKAMLRNLHLSYLIRDLLARTVMRHDKGYQVANGQMPTLVANSYKYLQEFKQVAEQYGYDYLVVTLPSVEGDGSEFTGVINQMTKDNINCYNLAYLAPLFSKAEYHASKYDWHPSALIHHRIGVLLGDYLYDHFLKKSCQQNVHAPSSSRWHQSCSRSVSRGPGINYNLFQNLMFHKIVILSVAKNLVFLKT